LRTTEMLSHLPVVVYNVYKSTYNLMLVDDAKQLIYISQAAGNLSRTKYMSTIFI